MTQIRPAEAVAQNIRRLRVLRRLSQDEVAQRMTALGYGRRGGRWNRSACSEVESGRRDVNIDEAVGLAMVLGVPLAELLDPGDQEYQLGSVGAPGEYAVVSLMSRFVRPFIRSEIALEVTVPEPGRLKLRPLELEGHRDAYIEATGG